MASIVNLQENIGKAMPDWSLGEEDPMKAYQRLLDVSRSTRKPIRCPKGVFRFKTHEEADTWLLRMVGLSENSLPNTLSSPSTKIQQVNVPRWLMKMLRWFGWDDEKKS